MMRQKERTAEFYTDSSIALGTGPLECMLALKHNARLKAIIKSHARHYKEMQDKHTQTIYHTEAEN